MCSAVENPLFSLLPAASPKPLWSQPLQQHKALGRGTTAITLSGHHRGLALKAFSQDAETKQLGTVPGDSGDWQSGEKEEAPRAAHKSRSTWRQGQVCSQEAGWLLSSNMGRYSLENTVPLRCITLTNKMALGHPDSQLKSNTKDFGCCLARSSLRYNGIPALCI